MNGDDALRQRLLSAGEPDRATLDLDRSGVRRMHAGDDLGECRLAGAILADEAANLRGGDRKIDAAKRADRREAVRQPSAPQQKSTCSRRRRGFEASALSHTTQTAVICR